MIKFLIDILNQARNLNLSLSYQSLVETLIIEIMPLVTQNDENGIITLYDNNIENILSARDSSFTEWADNVKNTYIPVPITPPNQ